MAIFGSLYLGRGADVGGKPRVFVRDLARPDKPAITFSPPANKYDLLPADTRLWGDWVTFQVWTGTRSDVYSYNYRTRTWGPKFSDGRLMELGDGVAVVFAGNFSYQVLWNFRTDTRTRLQPDARGPVLDDSDGMAFFEGEDLVVTTVPGMGASAPRLLGVVAPSSFNAVTGVWTPQFDATKPLAEGTLEFSHGTGTTRVVDRVLSVPASTDGSIRGVSWDGRDDAGKMVAAGTYTWTLKSVAVNDPAKALVAVDGVSAASGTVSVKTSLGAVTAVTPKVSDTTPRVGQTLTVATGSWKPANVKLGFQWYRDSTAVVGAKAANYVVVPGDVGHRLKVKLTGSCPGTESFCLGYTTTSRTSAPTSKVARGTITPAPAPILDVMAPVVDARVTGTVAAWGPAPVGLTYQWYKVNSRGKSYRLSGATTISFTPTAAEKGYKLKLKVTGAKPGYRTRSVYSARTGKVAAARFTSVGTATVSGSARVGMPLTVALGVTQPAAKVAYQWYRGTKAISGARSGIYRTTSADLGKQLKVRVTFSRSGYTSAVRYASVAGLIGPGLAAVTPKLDDTTPAVGQVLRITDGTGIGAWSPADATPAYQWYRDSRAITAATAATYTVQAGDVGHAIKVKLTGAKDGYARVARTSAASADVVKGRFTTRPVPTIDGMVDGVAKVGNTLTARPGEWAPLPTSFGYEWYRSGTLVVGQVGAGYTLAAADAGKAITVKVTARRSGFSSATTSSVATPLVVP